jgi:hypothetical protein
MVTTAGGGVPGGDGSWARANACATIKGIIENLFNPNLHKISAAGGFVACHSLSAKQAIRLPALVN